MKYLNDQLKELYDVTDNDYEQWCKEKKKPMTYKSTVSDFMRRLVTGRLKKQNGKLIVKKPRRK